MGEGRGERNGNDSFLFLFDEQKKDGSESSSRTGGKKTAGILPPPPGGVSMNKIAPPPAAAPKAPGSSTEWGDFASATEGCVENKEMRDNEK